MYATLGSCPLRDVHGWKAGRILSELRSLVSLHGVDCRLRPFLREVYGKKHGYGVCLFYFRLDVESHAGMGVGISWAQADFRPIRVDDFHVSKIVVLKQLFGNITGRIPMFDAWVELALQSGHDGKIPLSPPSRFENIAEIT